MHTIITRLEHTRNIQHCFTYGFKQTAATRQRAYKYARHVDLHVRRTTHIQKQTHKLVYRMYGMADYRWNITSQTSVVYHTTAGTRNVIFLVVGVCETYAVRLKHMSTSANSVQHIPPKHACYMGSLSIYRYIYIYTYMYNTYSPRSHFGSSECSPHISHNGSVESRWAVAVRR
jgi:hypothetical protein